MRRHINICVRTSLLAMMAVMFGITVYPTPCYAVPRLQTDVMIKIAEPAGKDGFVPMLVDKVVITFPCGRVIAQPLMPNRNVMARPVTSKCDSWTVAWPKNLNSDPVRVGIGITGNNFSCDRDAVIAPGDRFYVLRGSNVASFRTETNTGRRVDQPVALTGLTADRKAIITVHGILSAGTSAWPQFFYQDGNVRFVPPPTKNASILDSDTDLSTAAVVRDSMIDREKARERMDVAFSRYTSYLMSQNPNPTVLASYKRDYAISFYEYRLHFDMGVSEAREK